jgi:WD40 repeat protein
MSSDSAYVASVGARDTSVKAWRRLTFGSDEGERFDFVYLKHPTVVTSLQWRKPYHVDHTVECILYTFCADQVLRVWTKPDPHGVQSLQFWGQVDLAASLPDMGLRPAAPRSVPWAFIIQGRDLSAATERAVQEGAEVDGPEGRALQHLINVANRSSEICVVLDGRGRMSALSLENVGSKAQKTNDVFNIALVTSKDLDFAKELSFSASDAHVEVHNYCDRFGGRLRILVHFFHGCIEMYEADIARLFDETCPQRRLWRKATWSGHSAPIRKMVRNFSGHAVVSRTEEGEVVLWKQTAARGDVSFAAHCMIPSPGPIHRICVLRKGRFVVFLLRKMVVMWDCRHPTPQLLAKLEYEVAGTPLCLLILPRQRAEDASVAHLATVTSEKRGIVWEMTLPPYSSPENRSSLNGRTNGHANGSPNGHREASIREFYRFELEDAGDLAYVLPVDPAGATPVISGFLDVFARDVAISYTKSGRVEFWTARIREDERKVEWLSTSHMETGVSNPALVSGSTMKKAALVDSDRSAISIWDIRGARLEFTRDFEGQNSIQDLDWTSTPDSQSILAVGFPHRVLLLAQMRFDYLNQGPAWAPLREISIRDLTPHTIGDSTWLGDGHLVIGAGNQLFVYGRSFGVTGSLVTSLQLPNRTGGEWDLFEAVQRLNGPLPVYHPQFLSQCMLAGKTRVVQRILLALDRTLKFWVPGDAVDNYLGLDMEDIYVDPTATHNDKDADPYFTRRMSFEDGDEAFSEEVAVSVNEKLARVALPGLSGHEQIQLVDIVECVGEVDKQRRSMDENGARFMLFFRQHALRKGRTNEIHMGWREINWAYHSTSQDILVDFVSRQHHGTLTWQDARESGMFMWLTDSAAVVSIRCQACS